MSEDRERPALLGGLWALLVGGPTIAVLLVILHPATSQQDCSNYLAAGNASAFTNAEWNFYLPVIMLVWIALVCLEQALPSSWRHRSYGSVAARAGAVILLAVTASCCVTVPLLIMCH